MEQNNQAVIQELVTIGDYIRWGASQFLEAELFYGHGTDNAWDEAAYLILHALHLPHDITPQVFSARLTNVERIRVVELIQQRVHKRLPIAYLTNTAWFNDLKFYVDERVIIPRSPMAELIERGFEPWNNLLSVETILDLCTGSGCIAIACAQVFPETKIDAVDISADALDVARINVSRYQLEDQITLVQSDLFASIKGKKYDIIISNPPYVDKQDMQELPQEYTHEPALALAAGEDGLSIAKRILNQAVNYLTPQGLLFVEVGNSEVALTEQYPEVPFTWLEFERGGNGVLFITAQELKLYADVFN